jgi:hypothetical protein
VKPATEDTSHFEGQLQPRSFLSYLLFIVVLPSIKMSVFDAAPPNTHAGGNDDALRTKGSDPMNAPPVYEVADERMNMEEYERTVPLWKRVWQHSLTQMMLLSVQAFCGPAMADAIAGESCKLQTSQAQRSIANIIRTRWRWSRHPSNVQHRDRSKLHHVGHLLRPRRSHRQ